MEVYNEDVCDEEMDNVNEADGGGKSYEENMLTQEDACDEEMDNVDEADGGGRSDEEKALTQEDVCDEEMDDVNEADDGGESDEEKAVCSLCDDGGDLIFCDGRCIRSFHATVDAGEAAKCKSLGFSKFQAMAMQIFLCPNCQHNQHQCFACGKLGSSDKAFSAEVFRCVSASCGYFYHPGCVANLLHPSDDAEAKELEKKIFEGEPFTCSAHKCYICKQGENKDVHDLQFAVCRRCPKAYHRKCLPRKIAFENSEEDNLVRAWNGLLPNNRVLIYCLKHVIDENLGTPMRNHIIFPYSENKKKKRQLEELLFRKKAMVERRSLNTQDSRSSCTEFKVPKDVPSYGQSQTFRLKDMGVSKQKMETVTKCIPRQRKQTPYQVDDETKRRIKVMMKEKADLITIADVKKGFKFKSEIYQHSGKALMDKTITLGKVEGFTEAVRTALQKLESGGSVEDAKEVCGPEVIHLISKWKKKLTVYLSPFLHGNRYSSFGRHFTNVDKLKAIVDKLHWYTRSGDMVVDFCCGANDFSWLMKQKLEETGKKCLFRNFDLIQPKNCFSFEQRDWMTVQPKELSTGSNLIMGLNPPFGVKAALANKFIDKALAFKPKILILIVPPETERLDRKRIPYDLVWEDKQQLAGKSFYLPGSVDVNNEQIQQWNNIPPHLYLWSRPDWTAKHKAIALEHGHISKEKEHKALALAHGHISKEREDLSVEHHYKEEHVSNNHYEGDAQYFQPGPCISGSGYNTGYSEMDTNPSGTLDAIIRRYSSEGISLTTGGDNWSTDTSHGQEYNRQGLGVQIPSYVNDNASSYGYGQAAYVNELEYRSGTGVQQVFPHYGVTTSNYRSSSAQLPGQDAGFYRGGSLASTPYPLPGLAPESAYGRVSSSAMQQYAQVQHNPAQPTVGSGMFNNLRPHYPPGSGPSTYPHI